MVHIRLIICTYKRNKELYTNLNRLRDSRFLNPSDELYGCMSICIIDNASELMPIDTEYVKLYHNVNSGGSGGFARGMLEARKDEGKYGITHVVLMDDDVEVIPETFYRLYALLSLLKKEYQKETIAGRMFRMDKKQIQYTAAEIWNAGSIRHIGFEKDMTQIENLWSVNDNTGAEYSGWWFACFPMEFVRDNTPLPFFLHCDDVEYGLRHGGTPIILNGIQVWHETYEYRQSPVIMYYDMRNTLFVNEKYGLLPKKEEVLKEWKRKITEQHVKKDYLMEYVVICSMKDFVKGEKWLRKVNESNGHKRIMNRKRCLRVTNAIQWRIVEKSYKRKYGKTSRRSDKKEMVKVSIIVPIYNAEKYLEKCLKSIISQTFRDIEIICINDGSIDGSFTIMNKFENADSRVKVIHKTNSGYGNSMNVALDVAIGEYIGIVESDDWIRKDMYEILYGLTEKGTVDVVKANFADCYDEKDGSITEIVNQERSNMPDVIEAFTVREYPQILWGHPSIWAGIYRREFLIENAIRFKEEKGGGWVDNPFFFDTLCCAKKIKWINVPVYYYRKTNMASSSAGYDMRIPFERMGDNLDVLVWRECQDEQILKFAYARALMYLVGATQEKHYAYNEDYARPYMQKMLQKMMPDVIKDDFNVWDQKTYFKYLSPLTTIMPITSKILIYNWLPFDNQSNIGGGVKVYCRNLIASILHYRPDVQIYFLSSGWAYDISSKECYFRKIPNIFGERCRSFEIVNSPVLAPQDMLFYNPEIAFENNELKNTFKDFIEKNGPFSNIHFNNIEGLSLDILDLKEDYPDTQFIYSMHNYVPICMTGFYYQRDKHCNCSPSHTAEDCGKCISRNGDKRHRHEVIERAKVNVFNAEQYNEDQWALKFGFEQLDKIQKPHVMFEFAQRASKAINKNVDKVLAVSDRVRVLAEENGIIPELIKTSYIGTKIANYQVGHSIAKVDDYFRIAYLGSDLFYEEKGYPFLLDSLEKLGEKYASKVDLVLTTTTRNKDEYISLKLKNYHSVRIIHGYTHQDLPDILKNVNLGVIPVLWEDNLPQIAIEMVALGVPILCSSAGGASELCASEKFQFECGKEEDFHNKLIYFIENRDMVMDYWKYHKGLKTLKEHTEEMIKIYNIPNAPKAEITIEEYSKLLDENEFLYNHFEGDINSNQNEEMWRLNQKIDCLQMEYNSVVLHRDELQYQLNETRKSKTYKIGRAITFIPRKLRKNSGVQ